MKIRKGHPADIPAITDIYNAIHDQIEQGKYQMKWFRELYPTQSWAEEHIAIGDLYVLENTDGKVVASAIANGTSKIRANVCAINVLPVPVEPINNTLDF